MALHKCIGQTRAYCVVLVTEKMTNVGMNNSETIFKSVNAASKSSTMRAHRIYFEQINNRPENNSLHTIMDVDSLAANANISGASLTASLKPPRKAVQIRSSSARFGLIDFVSRSTNLTRCRRWHLYVWFELKLPGLVRMPILINADPRCSFPFGNMTYWTDGQLDPFPRPWHSVYLASHMLKSVHTRPARRMFLSLE